MDIREDYRCYVDEKGLHAGRGYASLEHRCRQFFNHVGGIEEKILLEIGGGEGLFSLWALANGSKRVILLEPEVEGSARGARERFLAHKRTLGIDDEQLMLFPLTIQEYEGEKESFDLVFSYSSINHLDERACVQLGQSKDAKATYRKIFEKVHDLLRSRGHFVISDCGRLNVWNLLRVRSPFSPTIDWKKHQEPVVWERLLKEAGFEVVALDWHRFYPLRWLGSLGANAVFARATTSQFTLTVRKA